ncbi:MAG: hypothetical protein ACP5NV_05105 [Candidatus Woesearchaeota archaeon]
MKYSIFKSSIMKQSVVLTTFAIFAVLLAISVSAKSTPSFIIAISEDSPSTDVILGIDIISTLNSKGYSIESGSSVIFEDLNNNDFKENIILHISGGEAVIIIGEDASKEDNFIDDLSSVLENLNVDYETTNPESIDIKTEDTIELDDLITTNTTINTTIQYDDDTQSTDSETPECREDNECSDGLACTKDTCKENKCIIEAQDGCEFDNSCKEKGFVYDNQYCDGSSMSQLKDNKQSCNAAYECISGRCKNNECRGKGLFQSIGEWITRIF